jgi:hypothetical protein
VRLLSRFLLTLDSSIEPGTIKGFIDNLTVQSIH